MRTPFNGNLAVIGAFVALGGGFAACADAVAEPTGSTGDHAPPTGADVSVLALRFEPVGETETSCGEAAGIHVEISDSEGRTQECTATWASVTIGGDYTGEGDDGDHLVADCFFVVDAGMWSIDEVSAVDTAENALPCCDADFPSVVAVEESETTEFGVALNCEVLESGALDIYGYLNRPPVITDMTISPSKFVGTCEVVELNAIAEDSEGDAIDYIWTVTGGPGGTALAASLDDDSQAFFVAAVEGDYTLDLEVMDPHGVSTSLDFPLHVFGTDEVCDPTMLVRAAR